MSDLLSPIYVVFDANEGDAFWGLVGVMKMMVRRPFLLHLYLLRLWLNGFGQEGNFLRDQSGMKKQLSTLQQLISILDPLLYTHLERTDSLNLFFTFRWILIAFKREFPFDTIIHLWEVLWTRYYSDKFVLFVAMAVLESHRDVIIRYLGEFDEVLKYANDLTGTVRLLLLLLLLFPLFPLPPTPSYRTVIDRANVLVGDRLTWIAHLPKPRCSSSVSEHLSRILIKRIVIWFPVLWLGRRITGYDIAPPRRQRRRLIIRKGKGRVKFPHRVKVESESEKTVTVTVTEGKGKRERKRR